MSRQQVVTAELANGAVTSAKILDATVATADLANAAVTNAKLASDTARANLLTNGGFEVWQRGNGPFTTGYCADRWNISGSTSTVSVSRDAGGADGGFRAGVVYTHSGAGFIQILQLVGADLPLKGRTITLSMDVLANVANTARAMIYDTVGGSRFSSYYTGSGVERLTVTAVLSPTASTIQVGVHIGNASCTAYIDNAMLVVGSVAADYAPLHPADDLARCQRYYEIIGETASSLWIYSYGGAGSPTGTYIPYKSNKAVAPTVTKVGTWSVTNCGQPAVGILGIDGIMLYAYATATGPVSTGNPTLGDRLVVEANP